WIKPTQISSMVTGLHSYPTLACLITCPYYSYRHTPPLRNTTKTIKTWPDDASQQLQDWFETTNWDIFKHQDLEVYTSTVLCYIKHCVDTVTVDRRIQVYPNQKPWMTKEVKVLLKERSGAFRSGDEAQYRTARANLRRGIREAKTAYKRRIEDQFSSNNK